MNITKKSFINILYILFLPLWFIERLIPRRKNLWIFGAWSGQKYSDNSRALYEYMLENCPEYTCVWITKNPVVYTRLLNENRPVAMANSIKGIQYCLYAGVAIVSNGNKDFNELCINGIQRIWLWHGMPLKKIGYDDDNFGEKNTLKKLFSRWIIHHSLRVDATVTASRYFVPLLQSAFHLSNKKILCTGLPRCDAFFSNRREQLINAIRTQFSGCTILFYMPTFRTASHDGVPYNPFLDIGFDETAFFDILKKKNLVFLYKLHFCDEASDVRLHNERFMQVRDIDFDDLYVLLNNVDILITDYSSVYFDFIVTRKPVILAPFDYEFYIKKARAHYFDYFKNMEGIKAKTWPELCDILENETYYPVSDNTIIKYCEYNDGNSSAKCFHEIRDRQTC